MAVYDAYPPFLTLRLCPSLRMYPQDNDTGGFFVTVLEKTIDTSESSTPTNEKEQRIAPEPT
jgi:hypothetical protein